jgi:hypothetical protein
MTTTDSHRQAELARRSSALADELRRRIGHGVPLQPSERTTFEGRLGPNLSAAMVHRSPLAGHLARALDADAFSAESHILGSPAALDVSSVSGAALLGHELAHVVQREEDPAAEASETTAQLIERDLESEDAAPTERAAPDPEVLAERVYRRMAEALRLERDRTAWIA